MDLDAGEQAPHLGDETGRERHLALPEIAGGAVKPERVEPRVAGEDLDVAAGCRVPLPDGPHVAGHGLGHVLACLAGARVRLDGGGEDAACSEPADCAGVIEDISAQVAHPSYDSTHPVPQQLNFPLPSQIARLSPSVGLAPDKSRRYRTRPRYR